MNMFSKEVKNELIRLNPDSNCCRISELKSIIRTKGVISLKSGHEMGLKILVESTGLTRKIVYLLKKAFGITPQVMYKKRKNLAKNKAYTIIINSMKNLEDFALVEDKGVLQIGKNIPSRSCCMRAYIRGAFLASGSVSVTDTGYHMEITLESEKEVNQLQGILKKEFDLATKYIKKKDVWILYQKNSDCICDMLKIMGAHSSVLKLEDLKVLKDMRSSINRMVNCETANLSKAAIAAMSQIENIDVINESMGLGNLDPEMLEIARLRLEYPYASLRELGNMADPALSKAVVSYRMKKLKNISDRVKDNK